MFTFGGVVARGTAEDPSYQVDIAVVSCLLEEIILKSASFQLLYISFEYETVTGTQQPQQRFQEHAYMAV